ncbi:6-bladed beta-propeller [Saccharicrinis sp. FJH2]|uniref:6-bladed beta-propeller n=1 Tax=Saccharicrinis sp. FJH65 TaxID=3344659 RepID=UPI0035F37E09
MNKTPILLALAVLLLIGCNPKSKRSKPDVPVTHISVLKNDIINQPVSYFIEVDSIVALETNDYSKIGEIYKVDVTDDRIYVMDNSVARAMFCFDRKGNFINAFHSLGNGPDEYSRLEYFDVYNDTVYITADPYKLFQLDKDLNLIENISISWPEGEFIGYRIHALNNDTILFTAFENPFNFYFYDLSRKKFISTLSKSSGSFTWVGVSRITLDNVTHYTYSKEFYDTIYLLTPEKMTPHVIVDFEDPVPPEICRQKEVLHPFNRRIRPEEMRDIRRYYETDSYIYFSFVYQQRFHYLFFNKSNSKAKILRNDMTNDVFGSRYFPLTKGTYKNSIITPVDASDLIENRDKITTRVPGNLNYNSNPVLVFFHPKF